jgi:hypothetical protein
MGCEGPTCLLEVLQPIPLRQEVLGSIQTEDLRGIEEDLLPPLGARDTCGTQPCVEGLLGDPIPSNQILGGDLLKGDRRQGPIGFVRRQGHQSSPKTPPSDQRVKKQSSVSQESSAEPPTGSVNQRKPVTTGGVEESVTHKSSQSTDPEDDPGLTTTPDMGHRGIQNTTALD